jgi:hypothetical protein
MVVVKKFGRGAFCPFAVRHTRSNAPRLVRTHRDRLSGVEKTMEKS